MANLKDMANMNRSRSTLNISVMGHIRFEIGT
jgi:hypothetical protein